MKGSQVPSRYFLFEHCLLSSFYLQLFSCCSLLTCRTARWCYSLGMMQKISLLARFWKLRLTNHWEDGLGTTSGCPLQTTFAIRKLLGEDFCSGESFISLLDCLHLNEENCLWCKTKTSTWEKYLRNLCLCNTYQPESYLEEGHRNVSRGGTFPRRRGWELGKVASGRWWPFSI